jgi:hypothetical protein
MHDFNPGFGPEVSSVDSGNGFGTRVFWTAVIPDSDVQVNPGAGKAEMHVRNLDLLDYVGPMAVSLGPLWQSAYVPATVSFDVLWSGPVTRRVNLKDTVSDFAGEFNENQATVTWSATSSSGFSFTSNPGNFSTSVPEVPGVNGVTQPLNFFAEVGQERNGIFFPGGGGAAAPPRSPAHGGSANPQFVQAPVDALPGATMTLSTVSPLAQPAVPLVATTVGDAQPTQPTASPHRQPGGTAFPRMVEQVFASQDGSALLEPLRTDDALTWAV